MRLACRACGPASDPTQVGKQGEFRLSRRHVWHLASGEAPAPPLGGFNHGGHYRRAGAFDKPKPFQEHGLACHGGRQRRVYEGFRFGSDDKTTSNSGTCPAMREPCRTGARGMMPWRSRKQVGHQTSEREGTTECAEILFADGCHEATRRHGGRLGRYNRLPSCWRALSSHLEERREGGCCM